MSHEDDSGARCLPSEEEIRRICEQEIQTDWTPSQRRSRGCGEGLVHWKPLVVKIEDLPDDIGRLIDSINKGNDHGDHKTEAVVRR